MVEVDNRLDPSLDISGSLNQSENLIKSEEPLQLGSRINGQLGSNASIVNSGGIITISGLTGITNQSIGRFLTLSNANSSGNNGTFLITLVNSNTSLDIENLSGISDLNNGNINWIERNSYSLEDDLNYIRTDRADIKGVNYYDPIPTYFRCNDSTSPIDANLSNIAGKTTDAKSLIIGQLYSGANVNIGDNFIHIAGTLGEFPYANVINKLGLPIHDGFDSGNDTACYCDIIDPSTGEGFNVLTGIHAGEKIFGFSRQGITGVDGISFEVELRSIADGYSFSQSNIYNWENGLPNIIDVDFPFRECFFDMDESALRTKKVHGITSGGLNVKPTQVGQILYAADENNLAFTAELPVVDDLGFIVTEENGYIVVVGK